MFLFNQTSINVLDICWTAVETVAADAWSQTDTDISFNIVKFMFDAEAICYNTGLENYSKAMFVMSELGYAAYYAHKCESLSIHSQFF